MIREIKRIFDDIRDAIIEMGGDVDICTSPEEYAESIKNLSGNTAVLFVPVFKASETKPQKPTGTLSPANPTDYPDGGGTPDGLTGKIWMSYTIVSASTVYVPGTEPILIGVSDGGSSEIDPASTRTFLIYGEGPNRDAELNTPQGGHWDAANNILTGTITSTIQNEPGEVVYWSDNNNHTAGNFTWLSTGTFLASTGELLGNWSDPVCINYAMDGKDGRNGVDGTEREYIYKLLHSIDDIAHTSAPYSDPDEDDYVPTGGTDQPQAIDPDTYPIEVMCTRIRNKQTNKGGTFSTPVPWAIWGNDGTDGDGVEYIFLVVAPDQCRQNADGSGTLTDTTAFPPMSEQAYLAVTRETGISDELALEAYQNDEFIPGDYPVPQSLGWDRNGTDDPSDVSENEPLEFVSIRKYRNETGGGYCEPKLWNKWAYVDASIFTSFAFTRTNENLLALNPPLVITGGTDENPIPDNSTYTKDGSTITVVWHDGVPNGTQTVWMTKRTFGQPNTTWSSPMRMADTADFQVEYSASLLPNGASTQLPSLNDYIDDSAEGVDEAQWRLDCANAVPSKGVWNDNVTDPLGMATCARNNGVGTDGTISRVRGENSIHIDLTNDKDELIYDHDGNKISLRNSTTNANLYDGATEVTSNIVWSISNATGVNRYNSGTAISDFPPNPAANTAYITTTGDVLVTGITAGSSAAVVRVKAEYSGGNYYKEFTVGKKVGQDNYDLDFTPKVIMYNKSTNTPQSVTINVKVRKESYIDGSITTAVSMPTGYKVFLFDSDSTVNLDGTDTDHDAQINLSQNSKSLKLLLATAKTGGTVEDGPEDIPVIIVENGHDGQNGQNGQDGAPGRGILSMVTYYMGSNDGTNHPAESSSSGSANVPTFSSLTPYLGSKIVTTYTDNTTSVTYSVSRQGSDGNPGATGSKGAKLRMRNGATDYTGPDGEGQYGGLPGESAVESGQPYDDAYYDIAIGPTNNNEITIGNASANAPRLWRCKARLPYASVQSTDNPSTLTNYFVQAQGGDFVATKLLLANRISADYIDVNQLSVKELHTSNSSGETLDIMNNVINLQQDGQTRCKISGENISSNFDNSKQIIVGTSPGNEFLGGPVIDDTAQTGNPAYFEGLYTLGTVHINHVSSGTQRDLIYSENSAQQGSVHLKGQGLQQAISGHNIECSVSLEVYAVDQNSGAIVQEGYTHEGSEALTNFVEYYDHFTLSGDPFTVDMRNNSSDLNNGAFPTTGGDYTMYVKAILMLETDGVGGLPSGITNPEIYLNGVTFDPIINHHQVATTLVEFTEIGADGIVHGINANNYFKLKNNNGVLELEFLSNGNHGLKIDSSGIGYYNNGGLQLNTP